MKILVVGSGGREHALTWRLRESQLTTGIYCAPGNAGIPQEAKCLPVDLTRRAEILDLARQLRVDLMVVGPEAPSCLLMTLPPIPGDKSLPRSNIASGSWRSARAIGERKRDRRPKPCTLRIASPEI
jgi:phosphoribosylglycinamide synthetase-like protein